MVLVVTGCTGEAGPAAPAPSPAPSSSSAPPQLAGTEWELTALLRDGVELPARTAGVAVLRFDEGGAVRGTDGCNSFGGDVRIEPGTLLVGTLARTKAACPGSRVDQVVTAVLDGTVSWAVEGTSLRLTRPDGQGLLYERKVSVRPGPDVTPLPRHP